MRNYKEVTSGNFSFPPVERVVVDLETTGLSPRNDAIVGIAFAFDNNNGYFTRDFDLIRKVLHDSEIKKIFHNAVFDLGFLKSKGFSVRGSLHDTMLMAHLHDPDRDSLSLKKLSAALIGPHAVEGATEMYTWLESAGLGKDDITKAPSEILIKYACEDAINTYALYEILSTKLTEISTWLKDRGFKKTPINYYKEEVMPLIPIVTDMELRGVSVDLPATARTIVEVQSKITGLENSLSVKMQDGLSKACAILVDRKAGARARKNKSGVVKKKPVVIFNWSSSDHIKTLLFDVLKEKPTKTTATGKFSVDQESLEGLAGKHEWLNTYLEYRNLKKIANTYLENLMEMQQGGRIHASFHLAGTATGRFSSSNPNMQNLPKQGGVKNLFVPATGNVFVYADYSQLELRVAAHLSQDPLLMKAYLEGLDLHQHTADLLGIDRSTAKTVNFAIIYNASGWRIAETLGYMKGLSEDDYEGKQAAAREGDKIIKKLFSQYTGLKTFLDKQSKLMQEFGIVVSEFGMVRRLPGLRSQNRKEQNHAFKAGFNMPIQGFGASLCKRSMIALTKAGYKIVNQVHDSIVVEVGVLESDKAITEVRAIMENIYNLSVPLVAEPKLLRSLEESDIYTK